MMRYLATTLAVSALLYACPTTALGQDDSSGGADIAILAFLLMSASTGSGLLTGYSLWGNKECRSASLQSEQYLRDHETDLRQDFALGSGPTVDDLAVYLELPAEQAPQLGRLLRKNRRGLLDLADPTLLTPERADAFFDRVSSLVATPPAGQAG